VEKKNVAIPKAPKAKEEKVNRSEEKMRTNRGDDRQSLFNLVKKKQTREKGEGIKRG